MKLMPRTLYAKLAVALTALLVALGVLFGAFTLYSTKFFLQELNQRFNRDLARQLLAQQNLGGGNRLDQAAIKDIFGAYMHINPAIEIYLLDMHGTILAFEAPELKIKRQQVDVAPIKHFLSGDERLPILGDDPRSETRRKVFSAAAIPFQGPPRQYLYVILGGEDYDTVQSLLRNSYFSQISTTAITVSIVIGLFAGLLIFGRLTRRLQRLSASMDRFRNSDFREHAPYHAGDGGTAPDEIDQLGRTFDAMARRISEQVKALHEKDALRRNLIANVSHDLRTPLASLQGYLETLMMKTGEMSVEQRRDYLGIAFGQSKRLTHLVAELFELSKLDASETLPEKEPVALGELIQDVAQKFSLQAENAGIRMSTVIDEGLPLVQADMAMINRVLENLTENALKHTAEGGEVVLRVERSDSEVHVSVMNSGEGISKEDLPHVFERFYQAPEKRRARGAGLGLAIVKRIIELHGGRIRVSNQAGGVAFCFDLPVD